MVTNNFWNSQDPAQVAKGGTGLSTITDGGIMLGSGTGAVTVTSQPTNGQLLIGSTGVDPVLGSLTAGSNISITPGAGSITIATTGTGSGNVVGTPPSTDMALTRWNGVNADAIEDSTVKVTDAGEMTNASQPAFFAYLGTTDSNVTGDGTMWQLGSGTALTKIYDQNADFNTNGTFTSPVTAKVYLFSAIRSSGYSTQTDSNIRYITSNRTYVGQGQNPQYNLQAGVGNQQNYCIVADMDLGDTAYASFTVIYGPGTKVIDIIGSSSQTYIGGYLLG